MCVQYVATWSDVKKKSPFDSTEAANVRARHIVNVVSFPSTQSREVHMNYSNEVKVEKKTI